MEINTLIFTQLREMGKRQGDRLVEQRIIQIIEKAREIKEKSTMNE